MSNPIIDQVRAAYKAMAKTARYRPQAPSDGVGNITTPLRQLNLNREATEYAKNWWDCEEHEHRHYMGFPDFEARSAFIYVLEAGRCISGMDYRPAVALLKMAIAELEASPRFKRSPIR